MDLQRRLEEIELGQILLGKYTGLLSTMYADKVIDKEYYTSELHFILNTIIPLCGIDSEEADYVRRSIQEVL
jgi:hypothetical protein